MTENLLPRARFIEHVIQAFRLPAGWPTTAFGGGKARMYIRLLTIGETVKTR